MTPSLEELSELEVELPARCRTPLRINLVEPIPYVYAQGSKGAYCAYSESGAPEQPRRIELAGLGPVVTAFEEGIHVQRLVDAEAKLAGTDKERVAE